MLAEKNKDGDSSRGRTLSRNPKTVPQVSTRNASLLHADVWCPRSLIYVVREREGCLPALFACKQSNKQTNGEQRKEGNGGGERCRSKEVGGSLCSLVTVGKGSCCFPTHLSRYYISEELNEISLVYVSISEIWFSLWCRERWKRVYSS